MEDEVELAAADDPDTVALTRPLPESDRIDPAKLRPDQLPSIGHIGRYALKYKIGEGGLGTVYAAHDPLLSRLIAIKTLHVDLPQADRARFDALFLNEARAAGSLNHTHIVTVYDAGTSERGPYIAMELLKGKDLRQWLQSGWRPTPAQAALIVRRVADPILGEVTVPGNPLRFTEQPYDLDLVAPLLGQHNAEVLAELGFERDLIEELSADRVLQQRDR